MEASVRKGLKLRAGTISQAAKSTRRRVWYIFFMQPQGMVVSDCCLNSQIHTAWRGRSLNSSNISSQCGLWMLCVYLTIVMQAKAGSQRKNPHQMECHCHFLLVASLLIPWSLGKDPVEYPRVRVRKHISISSLITSGLPVRSCALLEFSGNIQHLADLSLWKRSVQSIGTIRVEMSAACKLGFEWERRILCMPALAWERLRCSRATNCEPNTVTLLSL